MQVIINLSPSLYLCSHWSVECLHLWSLSWTALTTARHSTNKEGKPPETTDRLTVGYSIPAEDKLLKQCVPGGSCCVEVWESVGETRDLLPVYCNKDEQWFQVVEWKSAGELNYLQLI